MPAPGGRDGWRAVFWFFQFAMRANKKINRRACTPSRAHALMRTSSPQTKGKWCLRPPARPRKPPAQLDSIAGSAHTYTRAAPCACPEVKGARGPEAARVRVRARVGYARARVSGMVCRGGERTTKQHGQRERTKIREKQARRPRKFRHGESNPGLLRERQKS